jgi:putative DNA primase/helicase
MASVNAAELAARLGQAHRSGSWWRCRCPVHGSAGATLALKDGDWGLIAHCHAGCRRVDILAELRRRGLLDDVGIADSQPNAGKVQELREREVADRRRRILAAMDIWNESYRLQGNLTERYLRSRGITITIPSTIRTHGLMRHKESGEQRPAMVSLVEHVENGPCAVHVTYLNPLDPAVRVTIEPRKRMIGPVRGGAVRLGPVRPDRWLIIGEGVESTLSAMQLWGCLSGWAALSAKGLKDVVLPSEARLVRIAVDNDENGVGQAAARDAAWIWEGEGRSVRVALPPVPGRDFNDILLGRI